MIGTCFRERYQILAEIGKGGMSTVYLAKDKNLESFWAIKHVNNKNVDISAFKKEAELLSSLNHSDIPRIVDRIEINNEYFVIMDFIDGVSLGKLVLEDGPLLEDQVVKYAIMLCDVLEYLHTVKDNPIIYRDLKPENIMLTQSGRIKIIDFGIAQECIRGKKVDGQSVGTKGFAAPEQYNGGSNILDERTDIYGLGATLFFLVTGITPDKPPKGVPLIRKIDPSLSEGLEFIISKCTKDNPDDRYQNCLELREDLINIHELNSDYRLKMKKKLALFSTSLACCIFFSSLSFIGYKGILSEKQDKFQQKYNIALQYDKINDYSNASKYYIQAIDHKPNDVNTYIRLFNSLLPKNENEDYINKTKTAIDEMRKRYLENEESKMYNDPNLLLLITKKCIEVNDPAYASFACDYINTIKNSTEYKKGKLNKTEIDCYEILVNNSAKSADTLNFEQFSNTLKTLEQNTDILDIPIAKQLENYYTIMLIYSSYPNNFEMSYDKIYDLGVKCKKIIETSDQVDELQFNSIIPLYELVASSLYNNAVINKNNKEKLNYYSKCIEWFDFLNDLNADLPENLHIKRGNAYKAMFDISYEPSSQKEITKEISNYLNNSIKEYKGVINQNKNNFIANVYLTQVLLTQELVKPVEKRDFNIVKQSYSNVLKLKTENKNISNIALSQFSSLKYMMINAGLEG